MWVVPDARGTGVSRAMLHDLEARARDEGACCLRLETGIKNHAALVLYERAGFTRCGPFGDYKPDPLSVFMGEGVGVGVSYDGSHTSPIGRGRGRRRG